MIYKFVVQCNFCYWIKPMNKTYQRNKVGTWCSGKLIFLLFLTTCNLNINPPLLLLLTVKLCVYVNDDLLRILNKDRQRYCSNILPRSLKILKEHCKDLCKAFHLRIFVRSFKDWMLASRKYEELCKKDHWWSRYLEAAQCRFKGVLHDCIFNQP